MILAPQEINPKITTDEIKALLSHAAESLNVAVIVPSKKRAAEFWSDVAHQILTADNMEAGTDRLRAGHVGLTVFVAKYDGMDLPGTACEVLVIDGLPEVYGLLERIEQEALDGTRRQLLRQVQRIEQGMGTRCPFEPGSLCGHAHGLKTDVAPSRGGSARDVLAG